MVVVLQHQNVGGATPSSGDLASWASQYGIHHPVVADPGQDIFQRWANGQPRYTLLAPGAEIVVEGAFSVSDAQIEAVLPLP